MSRNLCCCVTRWRPWEGCVTNLMLLCHEMKALGGLCHEIYAVVSRDGGHGRVVSQNLCCCVTRWRPWEGCVTSLMLLCHEMEALEGLCHENLCCCVTRWRPSEGCVTKFMLLCHEMETLGGLCHEIYAVVSRDGDPSRVVSRTLCCCVTK